MRTLAPLLLASAITLAVTMAARAQPSSDEGNAIANALFVEAVRTYRAASSLDGEARLSALRSVRASIDLILESHPDSSVAGRIRAEAAPGGIDLAALSEVPVAAPEVKPSTPKAAATDPSACVTEQHARRPAIPLEVLIQVDEVGLVKGIPRLVRPETVEADTRAEFLSLAAAIDTCAPYPEALRNREVKVGVSSDGSTMFALAETSDITALSNDSAASVVAPPAYEADEAELELSRQDVRDLQARLKVLGFDPNGIDGSAGRGTRAALSGWQEARGLTRTGFLNAEQLGLLKEESQAELDAWLKEARNAELYRPSQTQAPRQSGLRNGWFMRDGKYCRIVQFGLRYCTPSRPPDA